MEEKTYINKITEEKQNIIKALSAFGLPNSPVDKGMKAEAVKPAFWKPIIEVISLINEAVDEINGFLRENDLSHEEYDKGVKDVIYNQDLGVLDLQLQNGTSKEVQNFRNGAVYIGSGEMPEGYRLQIDLDEEARSAKDWLDYFEKRLASNVALKAGLISPDSSDQEIYGIFVYKGASYIVCDIASGEISLFTYTDEMDEAESSCQVTTNVYFQKDGYNTDIGGDVAYLKQKWRYSEADKPVFVCVRVQ
jgi:hypothetical protein